MALQPAAAFPTVEPNQEANLDEVSNSLLVNTNPEPEAEADPVDEEGHEEDPSEAEDLDPADAEEGQSEDESDDPDDDPQESDDEQEEPEEQADDEDDYEPDEAAELIEVKVDGQVQQVTLDDLKRDYSGRQSIEARIQKASEAQKHAEAQVETLNKNGQIVQNLAQVANAIIMEDAADPDIDWDALHEIDPAEWSHQRELHRSRQEKAQIRANRLQQAVQQQIAAKEEQDNIALQTLIGQQGGHLREAIPVFKDEKKGNAHREALIKYAVEKYGKYGLTAEEVGGVKMAVPLIMLDELYAIEKGKPKPKGKKRRIKRTVRPGGGTQTSPVTQAKKRKDRLQKRAQQSGHPDDVAKLLLEP